MSTLCSSLISGEVSYAAAGLFGLSHRSRDRLASVLKPVPVVPMKGLVGDDWADALTARTRLDPP